MDLEGRLYNYWIWQCHCCLIHSIFQYNSNNKFNTIPNASPNGPGNIVENDGILVFCNVSTYPMII